MVRSNYVLLMCWPLRCNKAKYKRHAWSRRALTILVKEPSLTAATIWKSIIIYRSIIESLTLIFLLNTILKRSLLSVLNAQTTSEANHNNRSLVVLPRWTLLRMRTLSNRMEIVSLQRRPQLLRSSFMNRPLRLLTLDKYHLRHPI